MVEFGFIYINRKLIQIAPFNHKLIQVNKKFHPY